MTIIGSYQIWCPLFRHPILRLPHPAYLLHLASIVWTPKETGAAFDNESSHLTFSLCTKCCFDELLNVCTTQKPRKSTIPVTLIQKGRNRT